MLLIGTESLRRFLFSFSSIQSSQKAFEDHQDGIGASANELDDFGLDLGDLGDGPGDDELGDFKDIFDGPDWGAADQPGSPGSPGKRNSTSQPNSPSQGGRGAADAFRYGQEDPGTDGGEK